MGAYVMRDYRDEELKNNRYAMLAAVASPLQEAFNPILAAKFHIPNLMGETGGLSPSVLNGGLEQGPIPATVLSFFLLSSFIELQGIRLKERMGDEWLPGDYGLSLKVPQVRGTDQFTSLQEGEVWNSRIAMLAVLAYVVQEAATGFPTINTIPFF